MWNPVLFTYWPRNPMRPRGFGSACPRPPLLRLLLGLGLWLPAAALAAVLFTADFEAPSYALGPLHGQAGWTEQGGSGVRYVVVPNTLPGFASAGAQTLSMEGGGAAGGWIRSPVWSGITGGTVLLEADILPNPAKTTGVFLGNVGTGAGAYLFFEADGTLHVWNGAGMTGTGMPYAARPYHVKLTLDIDGGTYAVELDGLPFLSGLDARSDPGPGQPVETLELFSAAGNFGDFSYVGQPRGKPRRAVARDAGADPRRTARRRRSTAAGA
jgi:hypothetical protein